jgi:hypothetical protein
VSILDPQKTHLREPDRSDVSRPDGDQLSSEEEGGHGGHSRWMIACCIPMLAVAVLIAASGAGFGFLIVAVPCTAMMAMMVGGMSHGGRGGEDR